MAYNPYFPVGYQPVYYQNPTQFNAYPTQSSVGATQPTQSGIIWVSGESEASMYPIAPNNAVTLWDKSGKTVYVKSADATGKPSMIVYDLVERTETPSDSVSASEDKLPAYATKDELSAVLSAIRGYDDTIGSIKADIDTIKGDMYGIAGKKKPTRKVTEDDE